MHTPSTPVVTRLAPSPTGLLHVGTARTALFNYLYARNLGGTFLLRIEDTDRARSTKEYEENILEGLTQLGLTWDGMVRQSERVARHTECLEQLVRAGSAYVSTEPRKDDPTSTVEVVRLRNPGKTIVFHDEIRGDISFDTTELGDLVIARSITDPLYHFAVVVDDADMGVTHVIRGEDHISNTPRQILIQEALGLPRPTYAHLPLILAPDRSKMSKRKGHTSVSTFLEQGFYPEALVNFLALLGWNPGTDQELFTLEELVGAFSLDGLQKGGAVFDIEKLKWFNREYLKRRDAGLIRTDLAQRLVGHPAILRTVEASARARQDMLERFSTLGELSLAVEGGEFSFYEERPSVDHKLLAWKKDPSPERVVERLREVHALLAECTDFTYDGVHAVVWPYAEREGRGAVLWSLRYCLSGKERSPDPFLLLEALGREESLARISSTIAAHTV